jgi:hypothetical protein
MEVRPRKKIHARGDEMEFKAPLSLLALFILSQLAIAQQPAMSATTGLGPGDSFTLFIVFQNSMPTVQNVDCSFALSGAPKAGQQDFKNNLRCSGEPTKEDDKHYHIKVNVPAEIAEGDYKIAWINVTVENILHQYGSAALPSLDPVPVTNRKHVEFSPIKNLDTKH